MAGSVKLINARGTVNSYGNKCAHPASFRNLELDEFVGKGRAKVRSFRLVKILRNEIFQIQNHCSNLQKSKKKFKPQVNHQDQKASSKIMISLYLNVLHISPILGLNLYE